MTIEREILSTNNWGVMRILHGRLLADLEEGLVYLSHGEREKFLENNGEIRKYLSYLISLSSLGENLAVKEDIRELYLFVSKLLLGSEKEGEREYLQDAIRVLTPIYEAYLEREEMEEEKVLSGLTYGEKNLGEYDNKKNLDIRG